MNSLQINFLLVALFSYSSFIHTCYSWKNLDEDIQQMPQCNNAEKKEECQKIKDEIAEFKKAFDSCYGIFYTSSFVKQPYFKKIGSQALPEKFDSEIEEKFTKLFVEYSWRNSYNKTGKYTRKFLRTYLTHKRSHTITLKEFISQKLKEVKKY